MNEHECSALQTGKERCVHQGCMPYATTFGMAWAKRRTMPNDTHYTLCKCALKMGHIWITKHNCHRAHSLLVRMQIRNLTKMIVSQAPTAVLCSDKLLRRCVALAAFLHVGAAPTQFAGRPLMLQAMEARMVAGIAIVRPGIGCWWEAAWWKARGWWKLRSAASLHRLATIDFLGTGPTLDPLQRPFIVPSIAIEGAW